MKCLCCGKPFTKALSPQEEASGWHDRCVKAFFGTKHMPEIDVSEETLQLLAQESTQQGYTVPGVQKKLSLHLTGEGNDTFPRLTLVNYPTGYILKPQTAEYPHLPEAEYLVMQMAKLSGIRTVPFALVRMRGQYAYLTKRIDRQFAGDGSAPKMLAMEDFCQLDGRLTQDKYLGSYERCGKIIMKYSSRTGLDLSELFLRVVFSLAVGNSDMHLKNFSLIETEEGSGTYVLSDAYDLLPTNLILPTDTEQMALTLNGKKKNIRKKDLLALAESCGISSATALKLIRSITARQDNYLALCQESYLPDDMKVGLANLICQRIAAMQ